MITLQHSLVTLLHHNGDTQAFQNEVPYALLPDAIRAYTGLRQYSHFEKAEDKSDVSWMEFPDDLKTVDSTVLKKVESHMVDTVRPCCMGEETDIDAFCKHNQHLPMPYFTGVKHHLQQDARFDAFIREQIDCSNMYEDKFEFKGQSYDGAGIRKEIAEIEQDGLCLLAKRAYEQYGITTDQKWFDETVYPALKSVYSEEMADKTYKYMQIPEELNERIKYHQFDKDYKVSESAYEQLYDAVLHDMSQTRGRMAEQRFADVLQKQDETELEL